MRIMGVDFGDSRTGLAVSDEGERLASGLETVFSKELSKSAAQVAQAALQKKVGLIIVGNPVNMDGSEGFRAEKTQRFVALLKELSSLPVELYDERLTTVFAHRLLKDTGTFGQKRKAVVDTLSAEILLQNYLDSKKAAAGQRQE